MFWCLFCLFISKRLAWKTVDCGDVYRVGRTSWSSGDACWQFASFWCLFHCFNFSWCKDAFHNQTIDLRIQLCWVYSSDSAYRLDLQVL